MLGHPLFERTPRGVTLTPVGVYFQRRAEVLWANLQDTVQTAQRIGRGEDGSLVVGVCGSVMFTRFSEVVKRFRGSYPQVDLQLRDLNACQQVEQLLDGTLDISVLRDGKPRDGLVLQTLYREPLIAILPERHPLAGKKKLRLEKLREERFVVFSPATARIQALFCRGVPAEHRAGSASMGNRCQPSRRGHGCFHRANMCIALEHPWHNLSSSPVRRSINDRCRHSDRVEESCGQNPVKHCARGVWKAGNHRWRSLISCQPLTYAKRSIGQEVLKLLEARTSSDVASQPDVHQHDSLCRK
jgi:hypothetical protein